MSETAPQYTSVQDLFAKPAARRYRDVTLPVSGHRVRIQSLTEREMSAYQSATLTQDGKLKPEKLAAASRRLIALCLVDAAGNRILNDSHVARLAEWDAADTQHLADECQVHVGAKRGDVEDLVKNSDAIPAD